MGERRDFAQQPLLNKQSFTVALNSGFTSSWKVTLARFIHLVGVQLMYILKYGLSSFMQLGKSRFRTVTEVLLLHSSLKAVA